MGVMSWRRSFTYLRNENLADEKDFDRVPTGEEKMARTPPDDSHPAILDPSILEGDYEGKPTDEELRTLRRIPGNLPIVAYLICIVEFCERASYYVSSHSPFRRYIYLSTARIQAS